VDDFLTAGPKGSTGELTEEIDKIDAAFSIKRIPIGSKPFLGMEILRDRTLGTLALTQTTFTASLLEQFGMADAKPRSTPADASQKDLQKLTEEEEPLDSRKFPYSSVVGGLLWLSTRTRPDIAQAVGVLTRFMSAPGQQHWDAAMIVLRYLKGTPKLGLLFRKETAEIWGSTSNNSQEILAYADSDFAGCKDTRKSTAGSVFISGGAAISWSSKLQSITAWSTTEAEYIAAGEAVKEGRWLKQLTLDLGSKSSEPVLIWGDNQAALKLLNNDTASRRTKYIDVAYHAAREAVYKGEVKFSYISTEEMVADALTKPLERMKLERFRAAMGVSG
jgi:hypothetical protein